MYRREFMVTALSALGQAEEQPRPYVYKKAGGCEIKVDVFAAPSGRRSPVAVWIHGGALIFGRRGLSNRVLRPLLNAGFAVASIDYRLAPETKLPAIIEDLRDAIGWVRTQADALRIDPERVAVAGSSAGGYLTLMSGFCVQPRPKALASFWGYGDIAGSWYSRPDPFYVKQPVVTREAALATVGTEPLSEPPEKNDRFRFYLYCRQQGLWPKLVAGRDPDAENAWFDAYCPIRNVTREYPSTLLVHGTADTDVPFEQSRMMAERLRHVGVEHRFISMPDAGHGMNNVSPGEQDRVYGEAADFLIRHV